MNYEVRGDREHGVVPTAPVCASASDDEGNPVAQTEQKLDVDQD